MASDMCVSAELREVSTILSFFIKNQAKRLRVVQFHGTGPGFRNPCRHPALQSQSQSSLAPSTCIVHAGAASPSPPSSWAGLMATALSSALLLQCGREQRAVQTQPACPQLDWDE